ncbi:MAG TPA: YqgE/AlgH family protein [Stellaceae bacterium]|nr:YqgE/AlgH family protein [Stellaceae bacterium]
MRGPPRWLLLVLALWLAPVALTRAAPDASDAAESLAGQLIVAAPGIGDPRFDGAVILIIHHDKDGAFGIAINRPIGTRPLAELLEALGQDGKGVTGTARIFAGGPVDPEIGFVIHTPDYHDERTLAIGGDFAVTSDTKILRAMAAGKGPKQRLVAFGYAGWGPGQLEDEMNHNDWYATPADAALLFDADRDSVWQRAYDKRTMRL